MRDPRQVLREHRLFTKKRLGQNFLIAPDIPARIALAGGAGPKDTVFEIGAGCGTLTQALATRAAHVIALEFDTDLIPVLESELSSADNVTVRTGDIRTIDWSVEAKAAGQPVVVYGNVPYNLSTEIMIGLLDSMGHWSRACLLLQREFALRAAAPPGDRRCGSLSARIALDTIATVAFEVTPDSFHPAPKVHSAVLILEPRPEPIADVGSRRIFRQVVAALFGQRRKMARKALRPICDDSVALLAEAGLEQTRRGETFSVLELAAISRALYVRRNGSVDKGHSGD